MNTAGRFVLENSNGEVVRTFSLEAETIFLIYRHDVRRVELVNDTANLDEDNISYDILKKTSSDSVKKRSIALNNGGKLRFAKEIDKVTPSLQVADENEEQAKAIYKRTFYTQTGILAFIFLVGLFIEPLFMSKEEDPVVTVIPQEFIQPRQEVPTVKASETKVEPVKKFAPKKVVSKVKEVPKHLTAKTKAVRRENAPLRTKVKVENSGVLGVLGGMKTGSKNSAGFNANALNDSRGTSWNSAGEGGVGGMERAIPGKGLVGGTMGQGNIVDGGGYGTRGKAGGGRAGYGTMNMGGTGGAYFNPSEEEALVEGGLDKDQIAAVINRHIGEVIYCYEKGLQVKSGLSGRVSIKWVINGGGIVNSASVESSSLSSPQVESCIVNRLRGWKFPKPVGGVNVKVSYPFVLKRVNHG